MSGPRAEPIFGTLPHFVTFVAPGLRHRTAPRGTRLLARSYGDDPAADERRQPRAPRPVFASRKVLSAYKKRAAEHSNAEAWGLKE